jgi:sulfur carrier protein ThiS
MGRHSQNPRPSGTDDQSDTATSSDVEQPVHATFDGDPIRIPTDRTVADVKDSLGIPSDDTLLVDGNGDTVALRDDDPAGTYIPDGAQLRHAPLTENMFG